VQTQLSSGIATGIGGLPHRDASTPPRSCCAAWAPAIPTLPRRSPAEGSMAQAMVGMQGITVGQYGSIAVDATLVDPLAPIVTDLDHDAFVGFRTFLDMAREQQFVGPVKWQFVGPVSLGLALMRAGVPMSRPSVGGAVRTCTLAACSTQSRWHCRRASGWCSSRASAGRPDLARVSIAPDTAIDLVSGALPVVRAPPSGLHVCGLTGIPSQLAGPRILSLPVRPEIAESAGYLMRFMEQGGYIAWGVVPTTGPILTSAERPWRQLCALWCELVQRGADPTLLRSRPSSPECGLASHAQAVAEQSASPRGRCRSPVRDQATASRWVLGA
jgi:hypothetical protein